MAQKSKTSNSAAGFFDRFSAAVRASEDRIPLAAVIGCVLGVGLLLAIGVPRLRNYLDRKSFVEARDITLRFSDAPAWFDQKRRDELCRKVANAVGDGSTLDPTRLAIARDVLADCGWLRRIDQVSLEPNGGFLVEASFRTPFALVLHGTREHLVDTEGCRLPAEWELGQRSSEPHWITIVHARSGPPGLSTGLSPGTSPGSSGARWEGRDIEAALELLKLTHGRPWERQIAAIDLARFDEVGLVLLTSSGGTLVWGVPPNTATTAEPTTQAKMVNLDHLFATTGHIDNGAGRIIDLRTDVPSVRIAVESSGGSAGLKTSSAQ